MMCGLPLTLQAYPMAGTELTIGTMLIVVGALVCADDAARFFLSGRDPSRPLRIACSTLGILIFVLTAPALWTNYARLRPLDLPGARCIRLPEGEVARLRWISSNLEALSDTFVTHPGLNSLYFWARKEPPTLLNVGN